MDEALGQINWGDILTFVANERKLGGTVIDGVCRDIAQSLALKYPVFMRKQ